MHIAFIGLGVMGYPIAGFLKGAGHDITVFNRTLAKAEAWCEEYGGNFAATPAAAAGNAEIVFSCVGNDDDVRQVLLRDDGVLQGIPDGGIIIDHTTASAIVARQVSEAARDKHVGFLDAPLSGGQAGAENGQLTVMVGGDEETFARAEPVMQAYAKAITLIGPVGSGQLAKAVNQICVAGVLQGLSEGLHFAQRTGLDVEKVISAISKGAAQSWQMENRWKTMINNEFEFGFAVEWMRKDLKIALETAAGNGASLEVTRLIDGYYAEIEELGGGRWDTSSLIARLNK